MSPITVVCAVILTVTAIYYLARWEERHRNEL